MSEFDETCAPLWTVVANMTARARGGTDLEREYTGTRVFSAGTKLYLGEVYWGMLEKLHVIGRGRNTATLVNCVVGFDLLENVRVQLVYSSRRIETLKRLNAFVSSERNTANQFKDKVLGVLEFLQNEQSKNARQQP